MSCLVTPITTIWCDHGGYLSCLNSFELHDTAANTRAEARRAGWKNRRATRGTHGPSYTMDLCPEHATAKSAR